MSLGTKKLLNNSLIRKIIMETTKYQELNDNGNMSALRGKIYT